MLSQNCFHHINRPTVCLDIMNSDKGASVQHAVDCSCKRPFFALVGRKIKSQTNDRLAGGSKENRVS